MYGVGISSRASYDLPRHRVQGQKQQKTPADTTVGGSGHKARRVQAEATALAISFLTFSALTDNSSSLALARNASSPPR